MKRRTQRRGRGSFPADTFSASQSIQEFKILLFVAGAERAEAAVCGPNEFGCASGDQCIPLSYVCEDFNDCDDGSDEEPVLNCAVSPMDGRVERRIALLATFSVSSLCHIDI